MGEAFADAVWIRYQLPEEIRRGRVRVLDLIQRAVACLAVATELLQRHQAGPAAMRRRRVHHRFRELLDRGFSEQAEIIAVGGLGVIRRPVERKDRVLVPAIRRSEALLAPAGGLT